MSAEARLNLSNSVFVIADKRIGYLNIAYSSDETSGLMLNEEEQVALRDYLNATAGNKDNL